MEVFKFRNTKWFLPICSTLGGQSYSPSTSEISRGTNKQARILRLLKKKALLRNKSI